MKKIVTISMALDVAQTLHGFIDGALGTSEDDDFNKQMMPIRKKLEKEIRSHYPKQTSKTKRS